MKSMRPKWEGFKDSNSAEVQFYDQLSIFKAKEWLAKIIEESQSSMRDKKALQLSSRVLPPQGPFSHEGDMCWHMCTVKSWVLVPSEPNPCQTRSFLAGFTLGSSSTGPHFQCWWRKPLRDGKITTPMGPQSLWGHQTTRQDKHSHTDPISHGRAPGGTQHTTKEGQKMFFSFLQCCSKSFQPLFPQCLTDEAFQLMVWHCLHPSDGVSLCQFLPSWKLGVYLKLPGIYNSFTSYK